MGLSIWFTIIYSKVVKTSIIYKMTYFKKTNKLYNITTFIITEYLKKV